MTTTQDLDQMRERMLAMVRDAGDARRPGVAAAMRVVPRHLFVPEADPEDAYHAYTAVVTKRASDGASLSSASAPSVVAMMLDQLDVSPGHHVLEVGSGTGYNAGLLRELVGPGGRVVTVDVDPECTARTRTALAALGYTGVTVITGDGALGAPGDGPFDRIVVTAGAWDIPPAWFEQLAPGGRLVVPLRWRGQTRSTALTWRPGHPGVLKADDLALCGFIPLTGADGERSHQLRHPADPGPVTLTWDTDQAINPIGLADVFAEPATEVWSGVTLGGQQPFHGVWLRVAATDPAGCFLHARRDARDAAWRSGIPVRTTALADDASLAYFTFRRLGGEELRSELGAAGYGPAGAHLVHRLIEHIRAWDTARDALPSLTIQPSNLGDEPDQPGDRTGERLEDSIVIPKHHTRLTLAYPRPDHGDG